MRAATKVVCALRQALPARVIWIFASKAAEPVEIIRRAVLNGLLLIVFSFWLGALFAQTSRNPNPQGTIRITVNLVQVDAVVTDSKGHHVTNLRPENFEVLEDGRQQTITNFSYVSLGVPHGEEGRGQRPPMPPGAPTLPPVRLRPEQVRRTIAIVVDDLHISFEDMPYVRQALLKFADENVQPGDLVAIVRTSGGIGALQQFTNDKRVLEAAVKRLHFDLPDAWGVPGGSLSTLLQPPDGGFIERQANERGTITEDESRFRQEAYAVGTIDAIDYVVEGLRDLPGRKAVIVVSDTIPLCTGLSCRRVLVMRRLRELADLAVRSSAVLYTIGTRGLPTLQLNAAALLPDDASAQARFPATEPPLPGQAATLATSLLMARTMDYFNSQWSMAYLASQTGGTFVHDNNDLGGAIREIMDDLSGYYLLGYKPPADAFNTDKNGRGYHHIQVKVKVRGLHVRSRTGFYGVPDDETRPVHRNREDQLRAAVVSPFGTSGVHVELASQFARQGRQASLARLWLHIEGRDLTLQDAPDGTKKSTIDILGLAFGDNGRPVAGLDRRFQNYFQPAQLDNLRRRGVDYRMEIPIGEPGGYQLRVAVRDPVSQRLGSASQFIEIPDLKRAGLTLSGIVLNPYTLGNKGPAVRRFHAGDQVNYELEIYGARRDKTERVPDLERTVQILRDGHVVCAQSPGTISQVPWDSQRLGMSGELTLAPDMAPGDYALQVTVAEKLEPKRLSARQWIDFQIAPSGGQ